MNHPVLTEIKSSGCGSAKSQRLAFSLYLRLCEEKCLPFVDWHTEKSLDLIYMECKETKDATCNLYIPVDDKFQLNPQKMRQVIQTLHKHHENANIIFSFSGKDNNFIPYQVDTCLVMPKTTEEKVEQRKKLNGKRRMMKYVHKNIDKLCQSAKESENGEISVDPNDDKKEFYDEEEYTSATNEELEL